VAPGDGVARREAELAIEGIGGLNHLHGAEVAQRDPFDRHLAPAMQIARTIDHTEATGAEDRAELIVVAQQRLALHFPAISVGTLELSAGKTVCLPCVVGCAACRAELCRNHRDRPPRGTRGQNAGILSSIAQEEIAV
jgi:hypothetical protein